MLLIWPPVACNSIPVWWFRSVDPKPFQYKEHQDIMVISAEHCEEIYFYAVFELGTILLAENMSYYIMVYHPRWSSC
jgi:hypothetical protein